MLSSFRLGVKETLIVFFILYNVLIIAKIIFGNSPDEYQGFSYTAYISTNLILNLALLAGIFFGDKFDADYQMQLTKISLYQFLFITISFFTIIFSKVEYFIYGETINILIFLIVIFYSCYLSFVSLRLIENNQILYTFIVLIIALTLSLIVKHKFPMLIVGLSAYVNFNRNNNIFGLWSLLRIAIGVFIYIFFINIFTIIRDDHFTDLNLYLPGEFINIYFNTKIPLYLQCVEPAYNCPYSIRDEFLSNLPYFIFPSRPDSASVVYAKFFYEETYKDGLGAGFDAMIWFEILFGKLAFIFVFLYAYLSIKLLKFFSNLGSDLTQIKRFIFGMATIIWYVHFCRGAVFGSLKVSILTLFILIIIFKLLELKKLKTL